MAQNTLALERLSSDEGKTDGQTRKISEPSVFWFPVYEGIFEHAPVLKDAVWLFMWLIARTTRDSDGREKVLGGIPIRDERPATELNFPVKTVRRWRRMLNSSGYVTLLRTPYGYRYTLLKSKKWQKPTPRELPKRAFSESARNGQRELPPRAERVPEMGRESARSGKYKEDDLGVSQRRDSGRYTSSSAIEDFKGGVNPSLKPTPLRKKPTNRNTNELYWVSPKLSVGDQIADLESRNETVADYLADFARGRGQRSAEADKHLRQRNVEQICRLGQASTYKNFEALNRYCPQELKAFAAAFAAIDYPFAWDNPLFGSEFCQNVQYVVEESKKESLGLKKWELCEHVLDRCEKSWSELGEYCDVGLAYVPPDFNDHINRLFERE